jgi:uncharacterized membrane protein YkoI
MIARSALALMLASIATFPAVAVGQSHVGVAGGEVTRSRPQIDEGRLARRIPGIDAQHGSVRVGGDSAQRIAMADYEWRGRVTSVEFDEEDARSFWDVKIVPDSSRGTLVRYRIDASSGGILDIREFTGIRGVAARP